MLDYMKEQNSMNNNQAARSTGGPDAASAQDRDASGDYYSVSGKSQQASKSTYLLIAFFILGFGLLWLMIIKSTPKKAGAASINTQTPEEVRLENALTTITGSKSQMNSGIKKIVKKFYQFSDVPQVQLNELSKNPFCNDSFMNIAASQNTVSSTSAEMIRREQLAKLADSLQLFSIMQGSGSQEKPCCMINDRVVYVGDRIKEFELVRIEDNYVVLEPANFEQFNVEGARDQWQTILKLTE